MRRNLWQVCQCVKFDFIDFKSSFLHKLQQKVQYKEEMELLNIVTPKTVDKFVANKLQVKAVTEFLSSLAPVSTKNNIICLLGPDGCGKTTLSHLLLNKFNKQVLEIGKDSLVGSDIKVLLHNFANNMTIDGLLFTREKVVLIDDIDILMSIDKLVFSKLLSANKVLRQKNIKVVLTSSLGEERKLNEHSKELDVVKLVHPFYKDSYAYIMNCFNMHDVEHDPAVLLEVAIKCKGSIREVVLNLQATAESLSAKMTEDAFKDLNNFEVTRKILSKAYKKEDLDYYQRGDLGVVPYMLYENLPDELDANYKLAKGPSNSLIDYYSQVNNAFVEASRFEEKAYSSLDWQFLTYGNMLKMNSIHSVLSDIEKKAVNKDVKYRFSQLLSKTSHKNIMAKKVRGLSNSANMSKMTIVNAVDVQTQSTQKDESDLIAKLDINDKVEEVAETKKTTKKKTASATSKTSKTSATKVKKTSTKKAVAAEVQMTDAVAPCSTDVVITLQPNTSTAEGTSILNTYEKYFG